MEVPLCRRPASVRPQHQAQQDKTQPKQTKLNQPSLLLPPTDAATPPQGVTYIPCEDRALLGLLARWTVAFRRAAAGWQPAPDNRGPLAPTTH